MPSEAVLLTSQEDDPNDLSLAKLITFIGLKAKRLTLTDLTLTLDFLGHNLQDPEVCLILNMGTLSGILSRRENAHNLDTFFKSKKAFVLFYNISPTKEHIKALSTLSNGLIDSVMEINDAGISYDISDENRPMCQQLSGMSVASASKSKNFGFVLKNNSQRISNLISIDESPHFFHTKRGNSDLFFLAHNHLLDIDTRMTNRLKVEKFFSDIVPVMLFLKFVFKARCWSRTKAQACCTVDDPLLREPYGYLSYFKLIEAMDEHDFFTNIAFIPWNYRRSKRDVAKLLSSRPDRFGLSIHGCNHTRAEFMTKDLQELKRLYHSALTRMSAHQEKTGIGFDRIMVFPQAIFSLEALRMLKCNNFLAAASIFTRPRVHTESVPVSTLLDLAIMDYHSFPIITRRYPSEMPSFAFDLLLGKPALVYLHQEDYREDNSLLINHIQKIKSMQNDIRWVGLRDIARSLYTQKINDDNRYDIKLFANECVIENDSEIPKKYSVTKKEDSDVSVEALTLDEEELEYDLKDGVISFSLEIPPKSHIQIKTSYLNDIALTKDKKKYGMELFIWTRRHLSEYRDVYLSRSQFIRNTFARISAKRMRSKTYRKG